jgi:hypothetical protein
LGEDEAVAGKLDALVKLSVVAAVLLGSSSVAYYYVIYLPERDARIDAAKAAAEQRRAEEKAAAEQRRSEDQLNAQAAYESCIRNAQEVYSSTWAPSCKRIAQDDPKEHASCIATGVTKQTCDAWYSHDPSPSCALPHATAQNIEAALNKARDRCLQASKAGLL